MTQELERDAEHSALDTLLDRATQGHGGVVVVEGPAGIGKSSLIDYVRTHAKSRGFGRLQGSGDLADDALPWGVVRQLVERSITRYSGGVRELILDGPAGRALEVIDGAPESAAADHAGFARTLHALWWVAIDLASTRPLLITVDDAQWADIPTQRFLTYLARRIADLPIALVVGTRPPQDVAGPLPELLSGRLAERLTPRPLSSSALGTLAGEWGGDPAHTVVSALATATGGNPLLARQLLDELTQRGLDLASESTAGELPGLGPHTVSRSLLAGLSPEATALAGALAVLGRRGDLALASELADLDDDLSNSAVNELVTGNVLDNDPRDPAFVHPVVREAVLGALLAGERAGLHARAARGLHARGANPAQVAAHLVMSPLDSVPDGVGLLRSAAASLLSEGDAQTAANHLRRALDAAPEDLDLRAELGLALLDAGAPESARTHLLASVAGGCAPEVRAERLRAAALATCRTRGPVAAAAELEKELAASGHDHGPARLMLEASLASMSTLTSAGLASSSRRLAQFEGLSGSTQDERALLALLAHQAFYAVRPSADVTALVVRALADGRYFDGIGDDVLPWGQAVHALAFSDGTQAALVEIAHVRRRLASGGTPLKFSAVSAAAAIVAARIGDVRQADSEAAMGLASLALVEPEPRIAGLVAVCTRVAAQSRWTGGTCLRRRPCCTSSTPSGPATPSFLPVQRLALVRAGIALAEGAPQQALALALAHGAAECVAGPGIPAVPWRVLGALAAQRLGDAGQAAQLSSDQLRLARATGAASDIGMALRLQARLDPADRLASLTRRCGSWRTHRPASRWRPR